MERWVLILGVIAIFACLGVAGWYFQPAHSDMRICANLEAHCERGG